VAFEYQVIRRPRRKTAAITVKPDGTVQVVVPASLSEDRVIDLIERKGRWIKEKLADFEKLKSNNRQKKYASGESFAYLGRNYRLKVVTGDPENNPVKLMNGKFLIHVPASLTKKAHDQLVVDQLTCWYQSHAAVRLPEKAQIFAQLMGVAPASVGIKGYKSRLGTCHSDGRVYFNWRIIMAPHAVVDYVIVHELSHLVHHDHSKNFWNHVEGVLPNYLESKAWLRANGRGLRV